MFDSDSFELSTNAKWVHEASASVSLEKRLFFLIYNKTKSFSYKVRIKCILGHTDSVNCCQLMNNDEIIFTVSNDHTARLWDFKSGKEIRVYSDLHSSDITKAKVSLDNTKCEF